MPLYVHDSVYPPANFGQFAGRYILFSLNIDKTFYSIVHRILKIEDEKRFTWLFSMKNE